uniref:Putative secreted protein n=1 Tax=Anopheles darlingi TaxID=43151 RepID=A0A2M4DCR7_ANODA
MSACAAAAAAAGCGWCLGMCYNVSASAPPRADKRNEIKTREKREGKSYDPLTTVCDARLLFTFQFNRDNPKGTIFHRRRSYVFVETANQR